MQHFIALNLYTVLGVDVSTLCSSLSARFFFIVFKLSPFLRLNWELAFPHRFIVTCIIVLSEFDTSVNILLYFPGCTYVVWTLMHQPCMALYSSLWLQAHQCSHRSYSGIIHSHSMSPNPVTGHTQTMVSRITHSSLSRSVDGLI